MAGFSFFRLHNAGEKVRRHLGSGAGSKDEPQKIGCSRFIVTTVLQ